MINKPKHCALSKAVSNCGELRIFLKKLARDKFNLLCLIYFLYKFCAQQFLIDALTLLQSQ